jgi:hypothetical protein
MQASAWVIWAAIAAALPGCSVDRASPPGSAPTELVVGREAVHRLNAAEYNATVADVLGTKLEPASATWRGGELLGFDNMAAVLSVDEQQYERYFAAAKELSSDVVDSDALRARFADCDLSQADCAKSSIARVGLSLFRRPLSQDELRIYERLHAQAITAGDAPLDAFELVLRALLSSAQFIYRIELESAPSDAPLEVGAFDLASRLSYFLWSSAPDDALLQAAADGSLLQEAVLAGSVDRMLTDPKASRFVESFAGQLLGARRVGAHAAAPELYEWTPQVAQAAGAEIIEYFGEFVSSERSWDEFLKADVNYVTEPLARYYGIPTPVVPLARVEHYADQRAGFLGLAGFLALSSFDRRTSPSLRGRWISSALLCAEPPAPPANVPKLEAAADGSPITLNVRQALELHRRNSACAGCHSLFDPYGLALEEYDAVGQYRAAYADGTLVDASATLPPSDAYPDGVTFAGLAGVSDAVTADPRFSACLAQKLLMYGLGRPLESPDTEALALAVERWRAPGEPASVRRLLRELVLSAPFRTRLPEVGP